MARRNDRGTDFDDQWYGSRRAGEYKRSRGEGIWAEDKRLEHAGETRPHHAKDESCAKSSLLLAGFLSGFGWMLSETVSRIV